MRRALQKAGLRPDQVDYINAHGTSTPYNDSTETQAIKTCFGEYASHLAISSTKSMTGHTLGAAGGGQAPISLTTNPAGVLPPTTHHHHTPPDLLLPPLPKQSRPPAPNST